MTRIGIAVAIGLLAAASANGQPTTPGDVVVAELAAAWNARDASRYAALFASDADLVTDTGAVLHSQAEIARQIGNVFATLPAGSRIRAQSRSSRSLESSVVLGRTVLTVTGGRRPDGSPLADRDVIETQVMKRTAEGWRILSLQDTAVTATGGTATSDANSATDAVASPAKPAAPQRRCILARSNGDCLMHAKAKKP